MIPSPSRAPERSLIHHLESIDGFAKSLSAPSYRIAEAFIDIGRLCLHADDPAWVASNFVFRQLGDL